MQHFYKKFLERLNALRGERSVVGFARDCGIPQPTMANYCKGERIPSMEAMYRICNANVISADWLLGFSDSRTGTCAPAPSPESLAEIAELKAEVARLNAELVRVNGENVGLRYAVESLGKAK